MLRLSGKNASAQGAPDASLLKLLTRMDTFKSASVEKHLHIGFSAKLGIR
jgi:hypothetical protein